MEVDPLTAALEDLGGAIDRARAEIDALRIENERLSRELRIERELTKMLLRGQRSPPVH